jgi:hypothetical protein
MDILKFVASAMDIFLAVSCKYCGAIGLALTI